MQTSFPAANSDAGPSSDVSSLSADALNGREILASLICLRLGAAGTSTKSTVRSALQPLYESHDQLSTEAWRGEFDAALDAAIRSRRITTNPLRVSEDGHRSTQIFNGGRPVPGGLRWASIKNRYLIAASLEIEPSDKELERLGLSDGLYGAVLAKHHDLPIACVPTANQALEALAWKQLSVAHAGTPVAGKKFTRNAVLSHVFFEGITTKNPPAALAAIAIDAAPRSEAIRRSLIGRWLGTFAWTDETSSQHKASSQNDEPRFNAAVEVAKINTLELGEFANRIHAIAATMDHGLFGPNKVFISHLYRQSQKPDSNIVMDRATFDANLIEAGRLGLLTLNRADLVEAMDPQDVQESETLGPDGISKYHFVRLD